MNPKKVLLRNQDGENNADELKMSKLKPLRYRTPLPLPPVSKKKRKMDYVLDGFVFNEFMYHLSISRGLQLCNVPGIGHCQTYAIMASMMITNDVVDVSSLPIEKFNELTRQCQNTKNNVYKLYNSLKHNWDLAMENEMSDYPSSYFAGDNDESLKPEDFFEKWRVTSITECMSASFWGNNITLLMQIQVLRKPVFCDCNEYCIFIFWTPGNSYSETMIYDTESMNSIVVPEDTIFIVHRENHYQAMIKTGKSHIRCTGSTQEKKS